MLPAWQLITNHRYPKISRKCFRCLEQVCFRVSYARAHIRVSSGGAKSANSNKYCCIREAINLSNSAALFRLRAHTLITDLSRRQVVQLLWNMKEQIYILAILARNPAFDCEVRLICVRRMCAQPCSQQYVSTVPSRTSTPLVDIFSTTSPDAS